MTETPRHLTVVQVLPELNSGGVERGTLELGRFLHSAGHRSIVISAGGRLVNQLEDEGSEHVRMVTGKKNPTSLASILPLRKLLLREKVDILHLRSRMPAWMAYLAWLSIPKHKRPILITTFHGFYSVNCYSAIMTKGEAVIAVSDIIKTHIVYNYGKISNLHTIYRGVDTDLFDQNKVPQNDIKHLRDQWGVHSTSPVLMLVGRFSRLKGQDVFIKSLASIKDLPFQAVIVGDKKENSRITTELEQLIDDNKLIDRVKLVGHCHKMHTAYCLADCLISANSFLAESFGRTVVEAMAMEKVVIATAHGGSLETVVDNETGWLVPPADVDGLAKGLRNFLTTDKQSLRNMGKAAKNRVYENFTTQTMCKNTVALYHKMLDRKT